MRSRTCHRRCCYGCSRDYRDAKGGEWYGRKRQSCPLTYSLPAHRSSSCGSKAKVVTGVGGAFGVGPGRGILAAYHNTGARSAPGTWSWRRRRRRGEPIDGDDGQASGGWSYLIPIRLHISRLWGGGESMHGQVNARGKKKLAGLVQRRKDTKRRVRYWQG